MANKSIVDLFADNAVGGDLLLPLVALFEVGGDLHGTGNESGGISFTNLLGSIFGQSNLRRNATELQVRGAGQGIELFNGYTDDFNYSSVLIRTPGGGMAGPIYFLAQHFGVYSDNFTEFNFNLPLNVLTEIRIGGTKVVTSRQANVSSVATGVDFSGIDTINAASVSAELANHSTAINTIINRLIEHGLIDPAP